MPKCDMLVLIQYGALFFVYYLNGKYRRALYNVGTISKKQMGA